MPPQAPFTAGSPLRPPQTGIQGQYATPHQETPGTALPPPGGSLRCQTLPLELEAIVARGHRACDRAEVDPGPHRTPPGHSAHPSPLGTNGSFSWTWHGTTDTSGRHHVLWKTQMAQVPVGMSGRGQGTQGLRQTRRAPRPPQQCRRGVKGCFQQISPCCHRTRALVRLQQPPPGPVWASCMRLEGGWASLGLLGFRNGCLPRRCPVPDSPSRPSSPAVFTPLAAESGEAQARPLQERPG